MLCKLGTFVDFKSTSMNVQMDSNVYFHIGTIIPICMNYLVGYCFQIISPNIGINLWCKDSTYETPTILVLLYNIAKTMSRLVKPLKSSVGLK
jgi:hypothetical protein